MTVNYQQGEATGELEFSSKANQLGITIITVTLEDAGLDNDLSTKTDNLTKTTAFVVSVVENGGNADNVSPSALNSLRNIDVAKTRGSSNDDSRLPVRLK